MTILITNQLTLNKNIVRYGKFILHQINLRDK